MRFIWTQKKSSYCHISSLLLAQWTPWDFLKFSTFDKIETFCVAEAINFAKRFVADHAWNKEVLFLKIPHLSCFSMLSNSFVFIRRKKLTMKNFNFNHFLNKSFLKKRHFSHLYDKKYSAFLQHNKTFSPLGQMDIFHLREKPPKV